MVCLAKQEYCHGGAIFARHAAFEDADIFSTAAAWRRCRRAAADVEHHAGNGISHRDAKKARQDANSGQPRWRRRGTVSVTRRQKCHYV